MVKKLSKIRIPVLLALAILIPLAATARIFQIVPPEELIANSTLVFVGKVRNMETSSIATSLSHPTWEGVLFPWLRVDVEVLAPVKSTRKGDLVHVMMLSVGNTDGKFMYSPPQVLEPDKGDVFFFCLSPTPITNSFAALTAPYDEFLSVFPLHRTRNAVTNKITLEDSKELDYFTLRDWSTKYLFDDSRFTLIRNLANESGSVIPEALAKLKETYKVSIEKIPTNQMVYLKWQAQTNAAGWVRDIAQDFHTNSDQK
jgi:hypothetical protein